MSSSVEDLEKGKMSSSVEDLEKGTTPNLKELGERNPENDDKKLGDIPNWTFKEIVVTIIAAATAILSVLSILSGPNTIVYVASILGIIIPPYSFCLQKKITESEALKETNEAMDREVNNLRYENGRLEGEVKKMESAVSNLQEMEETLSNIRQMESASLDELEKQLVESKQILDKLEISLVGIVIQNIISVILACDINGDNTLQDEEIENLIKSVEGIDSVDVNDALIKTKIIERGRDINAVMALIRDVLEDGGDRNKPPEERLFTFIVDLDSEDSATPQSRRTPSTGSTNHSKRKCKEITSSSLDPNGDLAVRFDRSLTHFPTSCEDSMEPFCQLHYYKGERTRKNILYCEDCTVYLCVHCFKPFHTNDNLSSKIDSENVSAAAP